MTKYMKRATALFLALLLSVLPILLTSCRRGGGKEEILVWVAEEIVDFTKAQCEIFLKNNPDVAEKYKIKVSAMGEGETATQMLTDVESGADVYSFSQDQLGRLVQAGALAKLGGSYLSDVKSQNDEGSVKAVTLGETVYAYPLTSDNGYFLYYDKSVVKDPSTLDGILKDCKAAGKNLPAPFFAAERFWLNAIAKPDFIAYNCRHTGFFHYRLMTRLFPECTFIAWTTRKPEDEKTSRSFEAYIFEDYLPPMPQKEDAKNEN